MNINWTRSDFLFLKSDLVTKKRDELGIKDKRVLVRQSMVEMPSYEQFKLGRFPCNGVLLVYVSNDRGQKYSIKIAQIRTFPLRHTPTAFPIHNPMNPTSIAGSQSWL